MSGRGQWHVPRPPDDVKLVEELQIDARPIHDVQQRSAAVVEVRRSGRVAAVVTDAAKPIEDLLQECVVVEVGGGGASASTGRTDASRNTRSPAESTWASACAARCRQRSRRCR